MATEQQKETIRRINIGLREQQSIINSWNSAFYDGLEWEIYPGYKFPLNFKRTTTVFADRNNFELEAGYTYSNGLPLCADPSSTKLKINPEYFKLEVKTGPAFYVEQINSEMIGNWFITIEAPSVYVQDNLGFKEGGTVSQSGSKSSTVTLNKPTGVIITDNSQLQNESTVSFTLLNSYIQTDDLVVVQHVDGGSLGSYNVTAKANNGSATIYIRNIENNFYYNWYYWYWNGLSGYGQSSGKGEALYLRFAVIKSANS
jgi:hypothetical protein